MDQDHPKCYMSNKNKNKFAKLLFNNYANLYFANNKIASYFPEDGVATVSFAATHGHLTRLLNELLDSRDYKYVPSMDRMGNNLLKWAKTLPPPATPLGSCKDKDIYGNWSWLNKSLMDEPTRMGRCNRAFRQARSDHIIRALAKKLYSDPPADNTFVQFRWVDATLTTPTGDHLIRVSLLPYRFDDPDDIRPHELMQDPEYMSKLSAHVNKINDMTLIGNLIPESPTESRPRVVVYEYDEAYNYVNVCGSLPEEKPYFCTLPDPSHISIDPNERIDPYELEKKVIKERAEQLALFEEMETIFNQRVWDNMKDIYNIKHTPAWTGKI